MQKKKKQAVPHVGWKLISLKHYVIVFVVFINIVAVVASRVTSID